MERHLSLQLDHLKTLSVDRPYSQIVFREDTPFLVANAGTLELGCLDAIVWLAICRGGSLQEIYNYVLLKSEQHLTPEALFRNFATSLKYFYQNGCITIRNTRGPIEILSWNSNAVTQCYIFLTHSCNLRCKHCLISNHRLRGLSTVEVFALLQELWKLGCEIIQLSGGEVTIRKDFPIIVERICQSGMTYALNTNATSINSKVFSVLQAYQPMSIGVSLYGDNKDTHERVTRLSGSFEATMSNIKRLRKAELPVTIKTLVMKSNSTRLADIKRLAEALGCKIMFDPHILPKQDGSMSPLQYQLDAEELVEFYSSEYASRINDNNSSQWLYQDDYVCSAGYDRCAIGACGEVYPCAVFPTQIGNVREDKLHDIMEGWRKHPYLPKISDLKECQGCQYRDYCSPCPALSSIEEGDAKVKSEWVCKSTKYKCLTKC